MTSVFVVAYIRIKKTIQEVLNGNSFGPKTKNRLLIFLSVAVEIPNWHLYPLKKGFTSKVTSSKYI